MIKVIIVETETDVSFETEMPVIPKRKDKIGAWFEGVWYICEIHYIIYEFEENGDFKCVEIGVISR